MPVNPTLAQLRASALDYADMTGSTFPVAGRVTEYINRAIARFHDLVASTSGLDEYVRKTGTITLVPGTTSYTVASDAYKVLGVYYLGSGDRYYPLRKWVGQEVVGYQRGPLSGGTVKVDYFPEAPVLVAEGDTITSVTTGSWGYGFSSTWADWVALTVAIRLLKREESDATQLVQEREQLWQHMMSAAAPRDYGSQQTVADVNARWNPAVYYAQDSRDLRYRMVEAQKIDFVEYEGMAGG